MSYDYATVLETLRDYIDMQCDDYVGPTGFEDSYKLGYCRAMLASYLSDKDVYDMMQKLQQTKGE